MYGFSGIEVQIKYLKGVKSLNAIMHVWSRKRMHFTKEQKREFESAFLQWADNIYALIIYSPCIKLPTLLSYRH